jgi:hypothetical protein
MPQSAHVPARQPSEPITRIRLVAREAAGHVPLPQLAAGVGRQGAEMPAQIPHPGRPKPGHSRPRSGGARRSGGDDRGVIRRRRAAPCARRPAQRSGGLEIPPGSRPPRPLPRRVPACMAARGRSEPSPGLVSSAAGRTACPTPSTGRAVRTQTRLACGCLVPGERHQQPPSSSPASRRRRQRSAQWTDRTHRLPRPLHLGPGSWPSRPDGNE